MSRIFHFKKIKTHLSKKLPLSN